MTTERDALPPSKQDKAERRMPFMSHLDELRVCLRRAAIAYMLGCILAGVFSEELYVILLRPLLIAAQKADMKLTLNFMSPVEPFWVYFKVAMIFGLFVAAPAIFWQLWRFIGPGLYRREKRIVAPFTIFSALFFIGGALFCQLLMMEPVLSFAMKMLIAFGLVFELPLVLAFLASIGIVSARALWRFNKYAI